MGGAKAHLAVIAALLSLYGNRFASCRAEVRVERTDAGAAVTIDGKPFAEYRIKAGHQPVIWPIVGPGGQKMTRQWPLGEQLPTEKIDHPHHKSLWFNHGLVNRKDFWKEPNADGPPDENNQIVHRDFERLDSGETATIVTRNDWMSGDKKVCEDVRTIEFGADKNGRWIDFAADVLASEGEVVFGDTKEGAFGLRMPGTMDVDAKMGGELVDS